MKKITVSCLGLGMRGSVYLDLLSKKKEQYEIVSICDPNLDKLNYYQKLYNVKKELAFNDELEFFKQKRSDLIIIATLDKDHLYHLLKSLKLDYPYILCEKPFCTTIDEINQVMEEKDKHETKIFVCHVLRYAPAFLKAKELIDHGMIGELKSIDALERVGLAHQAHSYVRGSFGKEEFSSPMIMAKCSHDLDLLVWYSSSLCESISSFGSLSYFIKDNKPEGASNRCFDCKYHNSCYFDAYHQYEKELTWGRVYVTNERPITDEAVNRALENGPFGRCVFDCDNDVVDNQVVMMNFKNGVTASLRMSAFFPRDGRRYCFMGTKGEIVLDEWEGKLTLYQLDKKITTWEISNLVDSLSGHGGGDKGLIDALYDEIVSENLTNETSIEYSLESHLMALYAEESRLNNGKLIKMK